MPTQQIFEAFVSAVDGLDMHLAADMFADIEGLVADPQMPGTGAVGDGGVGDQQGVFLMTGPSTWPISCPDRLGRWH